MVDGLNKIMVWIKAKCGQVMAHGLNPACHLFLFVKYYWNTAALIHLCYIHGCFHGTMTELDSCRRNHMAHKPTVLTIRPVIGKSLLSLALNQIKKFRVAEEKVVIKS